MAATSEPTDAWEVGIFDAQNAAGAALCGGDDRGVAVSAGWRDLRHGLPGLCQCADRALPDVVRQFARIRLAGERAGVQRLQDARAVLRPDMAKALSPAQLEHEPVLHRLDVMGGHTEQRIGERDETVGDVGRRVADRAVDRPLVLLAQPRQGLCLQRHVRGRIVSHHRAGSCVGSFCR